MESIKQKITKLTFVVALCIVLTLFLVYFRNKTAFIGFFSPYNKITPQPVYSFSGKIENIEGNRIVVVQQLGLPLENEGRITQRKQPTEASISYTIKVDDNTRITRNPAEINYLFLSNTSKQSLLISDLRKGQYVTFTSTVDLNNNKNSVITVTHINEITKTINLTGKITKIDNDEISIQTFAPKEKEYQIMINNNTEISSYANSNKPGEGIKPVNYMVSDLKKNMQVNIYSTEDMMKSDRITALRIEPITIIQTAPSNPSSASPPIINP